MTRKDNILQELKDLNSSLGNQAMPWQVPAGYFESLAGSVLAKIKRMDAGEEDYPAASFDFLPKEMPFTVPAGYFESFPDHMLGLAKRDSLSVKEELQNLSPLLSGMKKEMPFTVPEGYFTNLDLPVTQEAKIIPITSRKWFRYAAAAVITGLIVTAGLLIGTNKNNTEKSIAKFEQKIEKEIEKTSDKELDEFLAQFSDAGLTGEEKAYTAPANGELDAFLDDVSVDELREFLDETAASESTLNETLLLN